MQIALLFVRVQDTGAERFADGGGGVDDVELFVDAAGVGGDAAVTDIKPVADLFLDESFGQERQDFEFSLREGRFLNVFGDTFIKGGHDEFRDFPIQRGASVHDGSDALFDLLYSR